MEDNLKYLKIEEDLNFVLMEEDKQQPAVDWHKLIKNQP